MYRHNSRFIDEVIVVVSESGPVLLLRATVDINDYQVRLTKFANAALRTVPDTPYRSFHISLIRGALP